MTISVYIYACMTIYAYIYMCVCVLALLFLKCYSLMVARKSPSRRKPITALNFLGGRRFKKSDLGQRLRLSTSMKGYPFIGNNLDF